MSSTSNSSSSSHLLLDNCSFSSSCLSGRHQRVHHCQDAYLLFTGGQLSVDVHAIEKVSHRWRWRWRRRQRQQSATISTAAAAIKIQTTQSSTSLVACWSPEWCLHLGGHSPPHSATRPLRLPELPTAAHHTAPATPARASPPTCGQPDGPGRRCRRCR